MYVDCMSRLPGQSLTILDRATMAYSLESRSPFLDPRFAEFMARVPAALKIKGRRLRYLERRLGERYLPPEVLRRRKQGFASPLMYILEEEVRALAPRLLLQSELVRAGYLRAERVKQLVDEHLSRRYDHGNRIWLLLSAEVWYRRYISRRSAGRPGDRAGGPAGGTRDGVVAERFMSSRSRRPAPAVPTEARSRRTLWPRCCLVLRLGARPGDDHPGRCHPALSRRQRIRGPADPGQAALSQAVPQTDQRIPGAGEDLSGARRIARAHWHNLHP